MNFLWAAVVNRDGKAFFGDVQGKIGAHDSQPDQTNLSLSHCVLFVPWRQINLLFPICKCELAHPERLASEAPAHDRFLGMHTVFRLIENHGIWSVHNFACGFVIAMGRQAMHEQGVGFCMAHQV